MSIYGPRLIRSAKSGSEWSINELLAYNIQFDLQEASQFFGRELGPIDHLDQNLLSTIHTPAAADFTKETYRFLAHLELASQSHVAQESGIEDFARSVLGVTGYDEFGTILRSRYEIPYLISGETRTAKPDVCLVHLNSMVLMVVEEDMTNLNAQSPETRIIAGAIAAFQHNNVERRDRSLQPLQSMTIPCITMVGARPRFYKVQVTQELSDAVMTGQYPEQPTIAMCCAPSPLSRSVEGMHMGIPEYRRVALQYFDAFRGFAKECWTEIIVGV